MFGLVAKRHILEIIGGSSGFHLKSVDSKLCSKTNLVHGDPVGNNDIYKKRWHRLKSRSNEVNETSVTI